MHLIFIFYQWLNFLINNLYKGDIMRKVFELVATNLFDSDELISEENKEKYFNETVNKVRNMIYQDYGIMPFVNDLKIHDKPRPIRNIKVAIYDERLTGNLKAYVYN